MPVLTDEEKLEWFSRQEGNYPHMYLDTVGVVTVGIGTALFAASDAQALPFVKRGTATKATKEEIETDWNEVHKQTKGKLAGNYKQYTKLDLPADEIAKKFKEHLAEFEDKLKAKWSNFNDFPKPAQLALLDMIYNLGSLGGFPSLSKAVDKQDWATAAKECHRNGPSETRNNETKELFEKAAKLAKDPGDAAVSGVLVKTVGLVYAAMAAAAVPMAGAGVAAAILAAQNAQQKKP